MATTTKSRCACGKVKSRYATNCRACEAKATAKRIAENQAIVATGKCPCCGAPLQRNSSLAGWWQCAAYGAVEMRKAEFRSLPPCSFQLFTA